MIYDTETAWFAGIMDGEGTVNLYGNREKTGHRKIKPRFQIGNCDVAIINRCRDYLNSIGVNPYIYLRDPKKKQHRPVYYLVLNKQTDIVVVLGHIMPYMTGEKKEHAKPVFEFCKSRIQARLGKRNDQAKYSDADLNDYETSRSQHVAEGPNLRDYT